MSKQERFALGDLLPNGARIIGLASGDDVRMVLCEWRGEYVTWRIDAEGNAFWGNYWRDLHKAVHDFEDRTAGRSGGLDGERSTAAGFDTVETVPPVPSMHKRTPRRYPRRGDIPAD